MPFRTGLPRWKKPIRFYHGEKVAFGVLAGLAAHGRLT